MKTEEGKKARKRLKEEWEKARHELATNGAIKDATKSLPETVQHTIEHIIDPNKLVKTTTIKRPPKKIEAPAKKKEAKKFKNT